MPCYVENREGDDLPGKGNTGYMADRCLDPFRPERLQDPTEKLSVQEKESYFGISTLMRDNNFMKQEFGRQEMEKVYDLLNTCDPVFYAPHFRESSGDTYEFDPVREYQAVYRHFLLTIFDFTDMDDSDVAGSISRATDKIVGFFENQFEGMLEPYCIAKGIQYYCNIYGIRCALIRTEDGVMYALSELDQEKTDKYGVKTTEDRLNGIVGAVIAYLDEKQYRYEVLNTTFMDRTLKITGEGVILRFSYLVYTDSCIVRAILHRNLRGKFGDDVYFSEGSDGKTIRWESSFDMKDGLDSLMRGIAPFLPEGGMPAEVAAQTDTLRKTVAEAETAYSTGDQERLNELINRAGDENEKLDSLCEQCGFPYEYVGNVPYRLYHLLDEMGLFSDDGQEEG